MFVIYQFFKEDDNQTGQDEAMGESKNRVMNFFKS